MLKKVIPIAIALCLIFSISVMAENTSAATDGTSAGASQQMPQGERPSGGRGSMPPMGEMPSGDFAPPEGFTPPDGEFTPPQNAGEFAPPQSNEIKNTETSAPNTNEGVTEENPKGTENGEESSQNQNGNSPFGGQMPEGMGGFPGNMQSSQNAATEQPTGFLGFVKSYSTPITSVVLLGLAYLFVVFYKRKHY